MSSLRSVLCLSIVLAVWSMVAVNIVTAAPIPDFGVTDFRGPYLGGSSGGPRDPNPIDLSTMMIHVCGDSFHPLCRHFNNNIPGDPFVDEISVPDRSGGIANYGGVNGGGIGFMDANPGAAVDAADFLVISTFYGIDITPNASDDDFVIGGFNPNDLEIEMTSETYIGQTQDFDATPLGRFTLTALQSDPLFDGFDFARFGGNPSREFYAFRAEVPLLEFAVLIPEPSSAMLVLSVCATIGAFRRRHL